MFLQGALLKTSFAAILIAIAAPVCVKAATADQSSHRLKTILIAPVNTSNGDMTPFPSGGRLGSLEIAYDPKKFESGRTFMATYHDLRRLSKAMGREAYRERLKNEVIVPISTENIEDLQALKIFTKHDLETFLSRKSGYLERLASVLSSLFLRPEFINRTLNLVNDQFFKHADVVARANASSTAITLSLGIGANMPEWFLARLRKIPLLSGVPVRAGFYLGFSAGLALINTMVDGVAHMRIEPVVELSHAEKIAGALFSVNTSLSVSTELAAPKADSSAHASFISCAGTTLISSPSSVGVSRSVIGIGLPPFGSVFAVIHGKSRAFRVNGTEISKVMNLFRDFFQKEEEPLQRPSCSAIFGAR